jgi:hypothetical protein
VKALRAAFLALSFLIGFVPAFAAPPPPVPALPDTSRITTYTPTASVGPFNLNFDVYGDGTDYGNWVEVWVNGVKKTAVTDWQLSSPSAALNLLPRPITDARVTLTAPATGTVQIVGARRPRRVAQVDNGRGIAARDFNQALTDLTAQNRELWDTRTRMLLAQPGQSLGYLPTAANCAGKFLGFDVTGSQPVCASGGAGTGNVVGPITSVIGHFPSFATTDGTVLADNAILPAVQFPSLTGDVTTPPGSVSTTLASVITAAGPRGSATQTPVITYDAKGRLTAVTVATIAPPFSALTGSAACSQLPALTGSITSSAGSCSTAFAPNTIVDSMVNSAAGIDTSKIANTALGVGAVPMSQKVINNRFIYATGYGAVCDGVTDDAAALQRAFAVADSTAGTLVFPMGSCISSAPLTLSGNSNVTIQGQSRGQSLLTFTGTTGGIVYGAAGAGWSSTGNYSRAFFRVSNMSILTTRATLHNAITAFFPYLASSNLVNFQFDNLNIMPVNSSASWATGIYVYNGWRGKIEESTINNPIGTPIASTQAIVLDGLSPAVQINHVIASYWDKAVTVGKVTFRAFSGTVTGTFLYAELVTGNTSGCQGRVGRSPDGFGGAAIVTIPTGGVCTNGETITGGTSGATITAITQPSVVQGNEGIYVNNSELILDNYAFYSNQPAGAATPSIGMWVQNSNLSCYVACIYGRYTGQWTISGLLSFILANGASDVDLQNVNIANIVGNNFIGGVVTTGGYGVKADLGDRVLISGNVFSDRAVGISLSSSITSSPSPYPLNTFHSSVATPVVAGSPTTAFNGPAAFSSYNASAITSFPAAVATKLSLTTESYDIGSFYDAPNSKWTPPPGRVSISGCATFTAGVAAGATIALQLWKNGSYYRAMGSTSAPTNLIIAACGGTTDIANGTDYYELYVYADGAGTKTVTNGPISTYFSGG